MTMAKRRYLKEVFKHLNVNKRTRQRIKEDLLGSLYHDPEDVSYDELVIRHGDPKVLARDFMESFEGEQTLSSRLLGALDYEYKSDIEVAGIPLIHINTKQRGIGVAKGIIAIGDIAYGLITIGGLSCGLLSLGGISLGLLAVGGLSVGLLSIGGVALGLYAVGGLALGIFQALGGLVKYLNF